MGFLRVFVINDLKNIRRDSLLLYLLFMPWLLVVCLRIIIPKVAPWFVANNYLALENYYPLILSFFIILEVPLIFGLVFGLLLLDEKDDGILTVLRVTPASVETYGIYRFIATVIFSVIYVMLTLPATGLIKLSLIPRVFPVSLLAGYFAVFVMLILVAFANNKVEGLALMKAMGILMLGPLAAYFTDSVWQILVGILPTYWPVKAFWQIFAGERAGGYLIAGFVYLTLLSIPLIRRIQSKIARIG